MGDSPAALLGIVVMWEAFGNDWDKQTTDVLTAIVEGPDEPNLQ